MKIGGYLNVNDPNILNILKNESSEMQKIVVTYLNNELINNSFV